MRVPYQMIIRSMRSVVPETTRSGVAAVMTCLMQVLGTTVSKAVSALTN